MFVNCQHDIVYQKKQLFKHSSIMGCLSWLRYYALDEDIIGCVVDKWHEVTLMDSLVCQICSLR